MKVSGTQDDVKFVDWRELTSKECCLSCAG